MDLFGLRWLGMVNLGRIVDVFVLEAWDAYDAASAG